MTNSRGIKKGVLELADALVVNKADGDQEVAAERTRIQHGQALSLLRPLSPNWSPLVLSVSSIEKRGIDDIWATILEHSAKLEASGERQSRRAEQARAWMWSLVEEGCGRHSAVRRRSRAGSKSSNKMSRV